MSRAGGRPVFWIIAEFAVGNPYVELAMNAFGSTHDIVLDSKDCGNTLIPCGQAEDSVVTAAGRRSPASPSCESVDALEEKPAYELIASLTADTRSKGKRLRRNIRRLLKLLLGNVRLFFRFLRFPKPEFVYVINGDRLPACAAYSVLRRTPLFYVLYEIWPNQAPWYYRWVTQVHGLIEATCLRTTAGVVSPHKSWSQILERRYRNPDFSWRQINHCPELSTGSDDEIPDATDEHAEPATTRPLKVYYHGVLGKDRGLETLVEAMLLVDDGIELYLRGFGGWRDTLVRLSSTLELTGRLHILDPLPPSELVESSREFDVGVSLFTGKFANGRFGVGGKFFQYLAGGVGVVCPDTHPLRDWVRNFDVGAIYRLDDPQSLAETLNRTAQDRDLVRHWKQNALVAAKQEFNMEVQSDRLREFVADVCDRRCA